MNDSGSAEVLAGAVLEGRASLARELTEDALAVGTTPENLLDTELIPAMTEAGRRFESHEFFLPDLLLAARAMKESLALLQPLLASLPGWRSCSV